MIVHTQAELDAALAAGEPSIHIDSPAGVWLTLRDSGSSRVEARGSSRVAADFEATNACGGGLHLGPTTSCATAYRPSAARWVRCEVPLAELLPILDGTPKVKVRECRVVAECDRFGDDLAVQL